MKTLLSLAVLGLLSSLPPALLGYAVFDWPGAIIFAVAGLLYGAHIYQQT